MTAKLLIRESGAREFTQFNGDYENVAPQPSHITEAGVQVGEGTPARTDVECASAEGERLCREGNVEAFQVWTLHSARQRVYTLEDMG